MKKSKQKQLEERCAKIHEDWIDGNYLRQPFFEFFKNEEAKGLLEFPTQDRTVGEDTCKVYIIPLNKLQKVIDFVKPLKNYSYPINKSGIIPLTDHKSMDKTIKVIYYNGYNYLVPPMFFSTGRTIEGWGIRLDDY